mgnify:CR=1 FL=1
MQFRSYQQTVLDNADKHLKDGKIHIVAAPGSGKTILGLELIKRLNAPALILSPSVTIRQQWGERFCEAFLPENENAVAQEFETPRLSKWLIALAIISLVSPSCSSYAEDSFPLIKKENQQAIINSLSHSLCEMAQASITYRRRYGDLMGSI